MEMEGDLLLFAVFDLVRKRKACLLCLNLYIALATWKRMIHKSRLPNEIFERVQTRHTMIAETRESQYEKRRQLEQRLEQDQEELEILQSSLTKTNAFSDKVVAIKLLGEILTIRLGCFLPSTKDLGNWKTLLFLFIS